MAASARRDSPRSAWGLDSLCTLVLKDQEFGASGIWLNICSGEEDLEIRDNKLSMPRAF